MVRATIRCSLALKGLRTRLAKEEGVPAYVIFSDRSPHRHGGEAADDGRAAFGDVHGVGQAKLDRYADAFLAVIRAYSPEQDRKAPPSTPRLATDAPEDLAGRPSSAVLSSVVLTSTQVPVWALRAIASTVRSMRMPSSKSITPRRLAADAPDQFAALDDLEVVEAEPVARRGDELVVGRVMRVPSGWCGSPCVSLRQSVGVELHFVHALLIESDRALRAEELHDDAALAAPGGAVEGRSRRRRRSRVRSAPWRCRRSRPAAARRRRAGRSA